MILTFVGKHLVTIHCRENCEPVTSPRCDLVPTEECVKIKEPIRKVEDNLLSSYQGFF